VGGAARHGPPPTANDSPRKNMTVKNGRRVTLTGEHSIGLADAARLWPTPTANEDAAGTPNGNMQKMLGNHPAVRGTTPAEWSAGQLNPTWVEWLMGLPLGWTDLGSWETE
jgi:DNA (cytosine-5)-methyltransferase 1